MIKKFNVLIMLMAIMLISSTSTIQADNTVNEWKYQKSIINDDDSGYKYVELDRDIYRYSNKDLSDIRVVNDRGDTIPFFIEHNISKNNYSIINLYEGNLIESFKKRDSHYFDFEIIKEADRDALVNYMYLNIDSRGNYAKTVEVYGSYDNEKWEYITYEEIYKISSQDTTSLSFNSLLKYNYYRIVVLDNVENISVSNIEFKNINSEDILSVLTRTALLEYTIKDNKHIKATDIFIDNTDKLKLTNINFDIKYGFQREYKLYDDLDDCVSLGVFSNHKNKIEIDDYANSETLKLTIFNKDDKALDINNIKGDYVVDHLVFYSSNNESYFIKFGNESKETPIYDITHRQGDIATKKQLQLGKLNILEVNSLDEISNVNSKLVLNSIIIMISILLIFTLIKSIKK